MAMTDYFKENAFTKITPTDTTTAYGNVSVAEAYGASFDGLLVSTTVSSKTNGAKRVKEDNQYNAFVPDNVSLTIGDKLRYTYRDGRTVFIKVVSNAILNDERSGQTAWKTYKAETYTPTGSLTNGK